MRPALAWVPAFALAVVLMRLVWLAWTAASRGVDFTDEGIYLLSYRYYRHPEMVYNGAPALFGPLFQLVGYSVVSLRKVKLVLVLLCGLGLGRATADFVRPRSADGARIDGLPVRLAIVLFVTVGGFTMYAWLPQSPGYNDLSALCATSLAAVILPVLAGPSSSRRWWLAAAGAISGIALLNKWPAGLCMVAVVAVVLILSFGWRGAWRDVHWSAVGLVLCWLVLAAIGGRFIDRLTELRSASEQLSDSLPIWDSYLFPYWRNVVDVARLVGSRVWLVLALGIALSLVVSLRRSMVLGGLLALGVLLAVTAASRSGQFRGGTVNVELSQAALPLMLALGGVVWLVAHVCASMPTGEPDGVAGEPIPAGRTRGAALVLLIGLGGAQAFGTLNPPMFIVISSGALCAAAIVIIAGDSVCVWRPAVVPVAALLVVFPLATERLVVSGLWQRPYRLATNLYAQTEPLDDVIGYDGLSTDSGTAELLHNLSEIARRRDLVGRPGLSVSSSPGYALALGLTHPPADLFVSSIEYIPDNAEIYMARMRTACSRGLISSDEPPVIVTAGPSAPADISSVLAECGIVFPEGFELELAESAIGSVGVWIPIDQP
jgi:hypothetical protein